MGLRSLFYLYALPFAHTASGSPRAVWNTHECVACDINRSLLRVRVMRAPSTRGLCAASRSVLFAPASPSDNAYIKSVNGRFRHEYLNENWFVSVVDAKATSKLGGIDNKHCPAAQRAGQRMYENVFIRNNEESVSATRRHEHTQRSRLGQAFSLASARAPLSSRTVAHDSAIRRVVQYVTTQLPAVLEREMNNLTVLHRRFRFKFDDSCVAVHRRQVDDVVHCTNRAFAEAQGAFTSQGRSRRTTHRQTEGAKVTPKLEQLAWRHVLQQLWMRA